MDARLTTQAGADARTDRPADAMDARTFAVEAARLIADSKCRDVVVLDVGGLSPVTQFIVIGTGTSDRQMRSTADDVAAYGKGHGYRRYGAEADDAATWIVADFVEVVVHLFEPSTRGFYDLEMLWGDATPVSWHRGES